jgi:hypothetical protein
MVHALSFFSVHVNLYGHVFVVIIVYMCEFVLKIVYEKMIIYSDAVYFT